MGWISIMGWKFHEILISNEFTKDEKLSILQDIKNNIEYITLKDAVIMVSIPIIVEIVRGMK